MKELKKVAFIKSWTSLVLLLIVSFMLVADLLFMSAQPQTFDEWSHLLTLNGFYASLSQFIFPVNWVDTVSNYGSPLGQISHQTTAYITAALFAVTHNTILSYNLTLLLSSVIATLLVFIFLRLHFSEVASLAGAILYTFSPYRIANVYVRGALPELFSSAFIPLVALGIHYAFVRKKTVGLLLVFSGSALIALSHPMMIILGFSFLVFYLFYAVSSIEGIRKKLLSLVMFGCCVALGIMVAAYYLLPLTLEIKYFHQGQISNSQETYWFLSWENFTKEVWNYYNFETVGVRENRLQLGVIEFFIVIAGTVLLIYKKVTKQKTPDVLWWLLLATAVFVFLMTPLSTVIYQHISVLAGIQFPWRFLIVLALIAPFFLAYLLDSSNYKKIFFIGLVVIIGILRFPQLYGKNYINFPQSRYDFTTVNPHSVNMNTVWSGKSSEYPVKENKVEIVEGEGSITDLSSSSTQRQYVLNATSEVRVVDYTFYFPGWNLYLNDSPAEVIYQDPAYRGVMTYRVQPGNYKVFLQYEDTKIRLLGKLLSLASILIGVATIMYYLWLPSAKKKKLEQALLG